jgi:multiple sugar transport system substrate-binding protein
MRITRRTFLGASLTTFGLSGSGCRSVHPSLDSKTHLSLWSGWTGAEGKSFQKVVDHFNAAHPAIFVENLGGVQDDTKTIRAITAGVPPDVFFLWSPSNLGPLVANNAVRPLDEPFRASGFKESDFIRAALEMGRVHGRLYSLPYLVDCSGLYWNKAIYREEGLNPERPPETLEELAEIAGKLTHRDRNGNILRLGLDLPDIQLVLFLFGGRLLDERDRPTADDPRNLQAFRWYLDLVKRMGGINQINSYASGYGQVQGANHPFFIAKTAMMLSGEYIPWWIERYAPRLSYGLTACPYPRAAPALHGSNLIGGNPMCIPTESRHPNEAWEFIRWVQSHDAQVEFATALNNVPNVRSVLSDPTLTQGSLRKRNYAKFLRFADQPNARVIPPLPVMNYYLSEITNARDFVLHGDKSPEQALSDVQRKVTTELDRFYQTG